MTNQQTHRHNAGISDVFGSMMGLAAASTRFTWRQMRNAAGLMTGSKEAWNDVHDSIEKMCDAMSNDYGHSHGHMHSEMRSSEPQSAEEAFNGRKV